jgi:hypothetical protein
MARFPISFQRERTNMLTLRGKRQRRASIEPLESRLVMTATATLTAGGAIQFLGQGSDLVNVTYDFGTSTYTISDNSAITVTNSSGGVLNSSGTGTDTITVSPGTGTVSGLTFNDAGTGNTFNIVSTLAPTTVENTSSVVGTDAVNVGDPNAHTVANILGALTISYTGTPTANVTIDDSGDSSPTSPVITSSGITGLAPVAITTTGPSIASLTISAGSGGNVIDVNGDLPGASTTVNAGAGVDLVSVLGTGLATGVPTTTLAINGQTGDNTLRVNATGTTANVSTAGTVSFGSVGGPSFSYSSFSTIQNLEDNHAPVITPAGSIPAAVNAPLNGVTVATFTDSDTIENASSYVATINWGDGSTTPGTIVATSTPGSYAIAGSHTFTGIGPYSVAVTLTNLGGTFNTVVGGIPVATVLPALAAQTGTSVSVAVGVTLTGGRLSPQTDTGISQNDAVTNNDTPTFIGNVNPGTPVEVFAAPSGSTSLPGTLVASGVGAGSGVWTATSDSTLANGTYTVTAEAFNISTGAVIATESLGSLTIDTVGPVVSNVSFNRFDATATFTIQDNLSGLDYASITNSAFYQLSARPISSKVHVPRVILPTSITITPGATPTSPETVSVTFYRGRELRGGLFTLTIDSGNNDNGLQDVAGNALDGNFYGTYPSGDGLPGGNFVALIPAFHKKLLPAEPIVDGYVPPVSTPGTQPTSTLGTAGNVSSARRAELAVKAAHQSLKVATHTRPTQVTTSTKSAAHDLAIKSLLSDKVS